MHTSGLLLGIRSNPDRLIEKICRHSFACRNPISPKVTEMHNLPEAAENPPLSRAFCDDTMRKTKKIAVCLLQGAGPQN